MTTTRVLILGAATVAIALAIVTLLNAGLQRFRATECWVERHHPAPDGDPYREIVAGPNGPLVCAGYADRSGVRCEAMRPCDEARP